MAARLLALLLLVLAGAASAQQPEADLALVLAADCSGSVTAQGYDLQQKGYAAAFRDPAIVRAIQSGSNGVVAVTYFQWSGARIQHQKIGWTILRTPADIEQLARTLEAVPRTVFGGGTSLSGAIDYGRQLLDQAPVAPIRRVIDVSGDGRNNNGRPSAQARDEAVAAGIVINGLPILNMEPDIDDFYQRNVIGGPGAFLVPARDMQAFAAAVRQKLIQEISELPAAAVDAVLAGR